MQQWGIIYQYDPVNPTGVMAVITPVTKHRSFPARAIGLTLLALGIGGMIGPFIPTLRLETSYAIGEARSYFHTNATAAKPLPKSVPVVFNPLVTTDGSVITPVNRDFSLVIPAIGVNAPVIANVDPTNYTEALTEGVAHASTSFLPDENGTVYLFSHSTNYDWFVRDLNAVFYLLKNLKKDDLAVLIYKGKEYTYSLRETRVVAPTDISYLVPQTDKKTLILQTCWPPGSVSQRLLVFADLIQVQDNPIK